MEVIIRTFTEISSIQLFEILKLRTDVFVVEQKCAYPEIDEYDREAHHFMVYAQGLLIAYLRVFRDAAQPSVVHIGRVVVEPDYRGKGIARTIVTQALAYVRKSFPGLSTMMLSAQENLVDFYAGFGFKPVSDPYPDFGVLHVKMILEVEPGPKLR